MRMIYNENKDLPGLAWIAVVHDGDIQVIHGLKVEVQDDFFVEGAWGGGNFVASGFDTAEWFCGTGGMIYEDRIVFATPTGMHAGLFMIRDEKRVVVSNSLCLLMAMEGYEFDPRFIGYEEFFNYNILQGIYKYNPTVHVLKNGKQSSDIQMILFRNITVKDNGTVQIDVKPETRGFDSFEDYYSRLVLNMKNLAENARDIHRKQKYAVTSFISSGYDSATCAAIAKEVGAEKTLTFEAKGKYKNDSGVIAARHLGYQTIVERDAYAYMNRTDFPETQSISGGDMGNIISFSAFEKDMENHLVFSGENGDFVWGKNKSFQTINDEVHIVWKNSEIGLGESHLHQGYIPVPMTSFGIRHWTDLFKISNSDDLAKWSIGGDYDRPIPRRILEEKGLPRESFGMKKYGAGFFYAYDWKKRILSRMSPTSAEEFERYIDSHKNMAPIEAYIDFIWGNKSKFWNTMVSKLKLSKLRVTIPDSEVEKRNAIANPFAARYLIPWAGEHTICYYKKALEG